MDLGIAAEPAAGDVLGGVLAFASALRDAQGLSAEERFARLWSVAQSYQLPIPTPESPTGSDCLPATIQLTHRVAECAEQIGALNSAYSLLASLGDTPFDECTRLYGRALATRARVARKADDLDVAEQLYQHLQRLGRRAKDVELIGRALNGRGIVAQLRGNYPASRLFYLKAERIAAEEGFSELSRVAHHGLMVVAAKRGLFAEALEYGWRAFREAGGTPQQEAEELLNLAQLALDVGDATASLHGFSAAVERRPALPQLLPALGGAARAAAALDKDDLLEACAARIYHIDATLHGRGFGYPLAAAYLDIAHAYAACAKTDEAITASTRAQAMAATLGFHEIALATDALTESLRRVEQPALRHMRPVDSDTAGSRQLGNTVDAILAELTAIGAPNQLMVAV